MTIPMNHCRWIADPAAGLLWRSWGDAHFAFDPRSGQTHFLNSVAVEVYPLLDGEGRSAADIYRALLERYDIDDDDALQSAIETSLTVLDRLGIVMARPA